jgi:hypothetical protein
VCVVVGVRKRMVVVEEGGWHNSVMYPAARPVYGPRTFRKQQFPGTPIGELDLTYIAFMQRL